MNKQPSFLNRIHQATVATLFSKQGNKPVAITPKIGFTLHITHNGTPITTMQPGHTYTLDLSYAPAHQFTEHTPSYCDGISLATHNSFLLRCVADAEFLLKKDITILTEASSSNMSFLFTIPQDTQATHINIKLQPADTSIPIIEKSFPLDNQPNHIDENICKIHNLALQPPEETIIINVSPHPLLTHQYGFQVQGYHATSSLSPQFYAENTVTNISELMRKRYNDKQSAHIRAHVRQFSENLPKLFLSWLKKLKTQFQDKLYIVIIDTTNLEIPWEMIEINDYEYIGTIANVVRWLVPNNDGPTLHWQASANQGSVIFYLDQKLSHIEQEKNALTSLHSQSHISLKKLEERIDESLDDVGLIYIGCHGIEGRCLQHQYPDQLTAHNLILLDKKTGQLPIAFVNACESARIIRDDPYNNSSFVQTILTRIASGYLGTLAKVGKQEASAIACKFFSQTQEANPITIPAILRDIRLQAVQELQKARKEKTDVDSKELQFLYTFLYVYYGNPMTTLKLIPKTNITTTPSAQVQVEEETPCNN